MEELRSFLVFISDDLGARIGRTTGAFGDEYLNQEEEGAYRGKARHNRLLALTPSSWQKKYSQKINRGQRSSTPC